MRLLDVEHGGTALQGSGHIRLRMGGRRRRNAVPGGPAHGGPCLDQFAGGTFRIVRGGDRRDHEPSIGCGPGQRRHVVRVHAAADHHRIPARLAQQLRPRDAERVLDAVRFDRGRIRLGGGVMQRSRADIVDGAARQRIGGLDVRQGFGGQADDGVGAEQGAISSWPMCTPSTLMPSSRHCQAASTRSSMTNATVSALPACAMTAAIASAIAVRSRVSACLARSWMKVAPPRSAAATTSATGRPLVSSGPTTK